MSYSVSNEGYLLEEAIKAQKALRALAGLGTETFPVQAFVGMISDEVEQLRNLGYSDEKIADVIRESSAIDISAEQIADNYAPAQSRHPESF